MYTTWKEKTVTWKSGQFVPISEGSWKSKGSEDQNQVLFTPLSMKKGSSPSFFGADL